MDWPTHLEIQGSSDEKILIWWNSLPTPRTSSERNIISWVKIRYDKIREKANFEETFK